MLAGFRKEMARGVGSSFISGKLVETFPSLAPNILSFLTDKKALTVDKTFYPHTQNSLPTKL